ncbi:MAG: pyrroline-5-carboxylate reductase [Candidatus Magasanikbacteria bacterium CG10_big_fil_rev_8_21_14_0_10_40_10]|uniref:Pyrroline-5-carboxylate reductase n=1 Tax=Candidatus Magasanikbacteria bacterium CG10_big_fil_rev_8_21_14_0_10_40_10 TaxID=1974648 RepID=A0A2M6W495_9BACT|nr:MAG: pyrroline-5-carboxylate reductase [Candidatus Magasanikbacteria bacterium CG10_big_fil_rev_8_21_14_0_10_40_10]
MIKKIAIIGFGNMGSAIYGRLLEKYSAEQIFICSRHDSRARHLGAINFTFNIQDAVEKADLIILAVKPQVFASLDKFGDLAGKLVVSIMAGVKISSINEKTNANKIVRAMPNLAVKSGQGVVGWLANKNVFTPVKKELKEIFALLGLEIQVKTEDQLDKLSAISGSGPAYFYYFCESLAKAGVNIGFSQKQAMAMVRQTFIGSADVLVASGLNYADLRRAVCSKGGSTLRALEEFKQRKMDDMIYQAVKKALARTKELGK